MLKKISERLFDLSGRVAIVTGSAMGLGKCLAEGLAAFGAKVVVCDLLLEEAKQTAAEIISTTE